jgi:hypothetical protein
MSDQPILQANGGGNAEAKPANPANAPQTRVTEANRVPMNLPELRLAVPDVPGYSLHWFLGQNVQRALRAGYEFLDASEANLTNAGVANDAATSGSTDLGSRVSVIAGGLVEGTMEPQRLYLMKIRQEWRDKDAAELEKVNERVAAAIRGGQPAPGQTVPGETGQDRLSRYLKKGQDLFIPKRR